MDISQFTLDDYEKAFADRHLLHDVVAKWAKAKPEAPAILSADGSSAVTWSEFDRITTALASELLRLGFAKGDFLVTLLPLSVDHVLLEYSCFKIGVIVAPLDLRLILRRGDSIAGNPSAARICLPGRECAVRFSANLARRAGAMSMDPALHCGGLGRRDSGHAIVCLDCRACVACVTDQTPGRLQTLPPWPESPST